MAKSTFCIRTPKCPATLLDLVASHLIHNHGRGRNQNLLIGRIFSFATLLLTASDAIAANPALFDSAKCDFTAIFPTIYQSKEIIKNGVIGVLATARPNADLKLTAECWPLEKISARDFAIMLERRAQEQGIEVSGVTSERTAHGDAVMLSGRTSAQGKIVHVRLISYFGPRYRFDLRILDFNASGSPEQIAFRNSVRLK